MATLNSQSIRRDAISILAAVSLGMDLLHLHYLEYQYSNTESTSPPSSSRFWWFGLWISPSLLTLGAFALLPCLRSRASTSSSSSSSTTTTSVAKTPSSPTQSAPISNRSVLFALSLAVLYAPFQELVISMLVVVTIHYVASLAGMNVDPSTGPSSYVATFMKIHFCGNRETFEAALPTPRQERLKTLAAIGPVRLHEDIYLQCRINRTRSWVMILIGLLVFYEALSANWGKSKTVAATSSSKRKVSSVKN
ncbi:hypothetical protein BGZ83_004757 [Gryganskiella cystojenkinii]|nr:hypothetical protein BGZ83_004757 [Gryganskiella cystojenkinii]